MERKRRDYIAEIKSIKARSEFNSRHDYSSRLSDIGFALNEFLAYNGDFNNEILKYIPIATVACFEAFFRSTVKEIIDFGKPYSSNIANFNQSKNIKIDFEVVAAIQTKTLTVGEFVAHILPYNNYEDLSSNLSILLNKDFSEELKSFYKKASDLDSPDKNKEISEILNSVRETFELRHIFCHEFATNLNIDQDQILHNYKNCELFLEHVNNLIWEILYPDSPTTQMDMNIQAKEKYDLKNKELHQLIKTIKEFVKEDEFDTERFDERTFDKCILQWEKYRELHAEYKASVVKGGSIYSLWYALDLTDITEQKITSLKEEFEIMLRKKNYS